uniref:Uncharacterized protein n=1 Tax=Oryza sativa subsp. japonica TaxID=39947 RepID=Q6ZKC6_ORYSJ|nr:hypothetical protein [Oryza sativa Japonica Group]
MREEEGLAADPVEGRALPLPAASLPPDPAEGRAPLPAIARCLPSRRRPPPPLWLDPVEGRALPPPAASHHAAGRCPPPSITPPPKPVARRREKTRERREPREEAREGEREGDRDEADKFDSYRASAWIGSARLGLV